MLFCTVYFLVVLRIFARTSFQHNMTMLMLILNVGKIFVDLYRLMKRKKVSLQSGTLWTDDNAPRKVQRRLSEEDEKAENLKLKTCLSDFGYKFSADGKLVNTKDGSGFVFDVKPGDKAFNQMHYEALGRIIDEEIYSLLQNECGLKKKFIPVDSEEGKVRGFVFASDDFLINEKMLVLIHGSGVVRAGQWARRLIINDSLESGTQIPYIKRAQQMGFSVLVLNTNQNTAVDSENREWPIKGSEDPVSHALYVWDLYISKSAAKNIAIVAHSAGGYVTVELALRRTDPFVERVFAVAFTDSVHSSSRKSPAWNHLLEVACNWACSNRPLNTELYGCYDEDIKRLSAGTTIHEYTSHAAIEPIFAFLSHRFEEWRKRKEANAAQQAEWSNISVEKLDKTIPQVVRTDDDIQNESHAGNSSDRLLDEQKEHGVIQDPKGEIVSRSDCVVQTSF